MFFLEGMATELINPKLHPTETELDPYYWMDGSCWKFMPVYSDGIWNLKLNGSIFKHPLVLLHIQLAVIVTLTSVIHYVFKQLNLPRIVSEIMAGFILGPTMLQQLCPKLILDVLFPQESEYILSTLSKFGFLFFMFLIGVKMDVNLLFKYGRKPWIIGTASLVIPLIFMLQYFSYSTDDLSRNATEGNEELEWIRLFGLTVTQTQFPVISCLLMHLKIINSELGHIALASALICDLLSLIVTTMTVYARVMSEASIRVGFGSIGLCVVVVVFVVVILRPIMFLIIKRTPEGKPVKEVYTIFIMALVMALAMACNAIGLQFLLGPFIFGLAVPTGPPLASTLVNRFDAIISGLLTPLLTTYCGYKSNLWKLFTEMQPQDAILVLFGLVVKFLGTFVPAIICKIPPKDAVALTLILSAKGIVELGKVSIIANDKLMDGVLFSLAVFVTFAIAAVVPLLVRMSYDPSKRYLGYQKKNILEHQIDAELKILACAHRQDDAIAAIKLLEVSSPTQSPLSIYGLYLKVLTDEAVPVIINHQLGKKNTSSESTRWQPIIDVFYYFKTQHKSLSHVHVFTAISPPKMMDEDVCNVAFDKSVSLIILPFHRRWNTKRNLISDSTRLRNMNIKVMDKAPCSVGILVDRRNKYGSSSVFITLHTYRVAMLYLGGDDDREALAYAKRMAGCPRVHVTIFRFIPSDDCSHAGWEGMLDNESLRGSREVNIMYLEETVRDGSDTARIIRSIEEEYDLIIVGRHHDPHSVLTLGLSDWSDFPELGPIGDLLASSDITNPVSVLVIQQQITEAKKE